MKGKPGKMGTMDYCGKTEDGYDSKKMPRKCMKLALACINSEPDQEVMLHLGECKNCDKENVCLSNTNPKAFKVGGRKRVSKKMKNPIWTRPVCDEDGEVKFDNLCDFHMARCETFKDDGPMPEGGSRIYSILVFLTKKHSINFQW